MLTRMRGASVISGRIIIVVIITGSVRQQQQQQQMSLLSRGYLS